MYRFCTRRTTTTHNSGFTLIELLVVISIIGVLASVVLASLSAGREKAQDTSRIASLKQLQSAVEIYYTNNNRYPPVSSGSSYVAGIVGLAPTYIPVLPEDPDRVIPYTYRYLSSNYTLGYTILVDLVGDGDNNWCRMGVEPGQVSWDATYPRC